jgi:glycosyltransferase involved in cell wall biosynthesis
VFELGTAEYRARSYARALIQNVPAGVPVVVSDDPDVWGGAALVAHRHPVIGVMHADDTAYYRLAKRYGGIVAALVCVSSRIEKSTRSMLEGRSSPVVVTIPCGIPLPTRGVSPARDGKFRISWAGRMDEEQKRVGDLVRVMARARAAGLPATLDIVGDGPERQRVEDAAAEAGVASQITVHGWQSIARVMEVLGHSDAFLLTSNYEGMPIAIMEALACGCAVVSTRVSGVEDYESSPIAANALWTFPVGDIEAAVAALHAVARVPRATRQRASRSLAEAEFAIGTCMDRYDALLHSLAGEPRRSASITGLTLMSYAQALIVATARRVRLHVGGNVAGRYAARLS